MVTGIIDVGSNTIRLSIFKHEKNGSFYSLISEKSVVGLVGYVSKGELSTKGIARLCRCLTDYMSIVKNLDVDEVHAFATASLRYVSNAKEVVARVLDVTGLKLELLSGDDEAHLSFVGARHSTGIEAGLVVDIGGASCELVRVTKGVAGESYSIPLGSLSLSLEANRGIFPKKNSVKEMNSIINKRLKEVSSIFKKETKTLCFVGGTARASYRVAREFEGGNGRLIEDWELADIIEGYEKQNVELIQAIRSAAPERVFTLLAGILIMRAIIKQSGATELLVAKSGVREGYLIEKVIGN
ncbi:MAG: exopolyphosphatase [Coriobacteriia bacterium]|jgi:exopolyphosphatase/guanosine-5'-triphosphate,3'-diphosphate pyrophosphatase|nr:exopolyphosphatase [Coriobacteriia bacterium]MDR2714070.1 hypothetical protein [Coriobacteriales bacterium]